jgi:uncharacterized membrane protein YcaP (DUF421 family)
MQIVVRASAMFLFLWFVMRAIGRKELAGMSAFELILLIVMGDLIQQGVTQQDSSLAGAALAIATIALWMLALSYVSYRFGRARRILEGEPVVLVRNGRIQRKMLEYERLTEDELKDEARGQGIADLAEVALALLESDGKFSFLRFDQLRTGEAGGPPGS